MRFTIALSVGMLSLTLPGPAAAEVEEAKARFTPWSGYWWPHHEGGLARPLGKYDKVTGKRATQWEKLHHPLGRSVPRWFGYCHAWAASAVMEKEPRQSRTASARSGRGVQLGVGDQKGILTACHTDDVANTYGERNNGAGDPQDIRPDVLWRLLRLYVKNQGIPLILDIDAGPQVWNYPIYAYRIVYNSRAGGNHLAGLTLWMADDQVAPDYVGVKARRQTYQFTCKMQGGSVVMGSAQWVGASRRDHPDFAWYPQVAVSENPHIDYATVKKMLGRSQEGTPDPGPENPDNPEDPDTPAGPSSPDHPKPPPARPRQVVAVSPLELVALVANKTSSFKFDVTVDRFDGGLYKAGEPFSIRGSSEKEGYLYLFHIAPDGELKLLFPVGKQDNRIAAREQFELPGPKGRFAFVAEEPLGVHRVKAIITGKPLILTGLDPINPGRQETENGGSKKRGQSQGFRWHPTQKEQIQQFMAQKSVSPEMVDEFTGVKPRQVLGAFAQDEVAFVVEPGGNGKPKAKEEPAPKEKSKPKKKRK